MITAEKNIVIFLQYPIQHRKIAETLQNDFTETLQYCMVVAELLQNSNNVKMSTFCYTYCNKTFQQNCNVMYLNTFFTKTLK